MSNAAKLRKKAAEFEALKQIDRAIAMYARAIEETEAEGDEVDVAVLNKVGDLTLRQGRVADAVTYYERAVDHYATVGLFNNAIALCNKIVRNAPGRSNVYFTLGRICAKKGLRSDATRNFLEYATRMQQDGRVDEGMRALAEVADLMPELTEIRGLVDDHAERAGITLPRRRTPTSAVAQPDAASRAGLGDKSADLIFLDVEYNTRRTPSRAARIPTPFATALAIAANRAVPSPVSPEVAEQIDADDDDPLLQIAARQADLDGLELVDHVSDDGNDRSAELDAISGSAEIVPADGLIGAALPQSANPAGPDAIAALAPVVGLEDNGDFSGTSVGTLPGFTSDDFAGSETLGVGAVGGSTTFDGPLHVDHGVGVTADAVDDSPAVAGRHPDSVDSSSDDTAPPIDAPMVSTEMVDVEHQDFDLDLELHDESGDASHIEWLEVDAVPELDDAIAAGEASARAGEGSLQLQAETAAPPPPFRLDPHDFILPGELPPLVLDDDVVDAGLLRARLEAPSAVPRAYTTPSLPIASVAVEANVVAVARRDSLRAAVADTPRDWVLRRRLAETLFEAGERDAGLAELETALTGFAGSGDLASAAELADELVRVAADRVQYHQKRVELAVRLQDQARLRASYLDLADALVQHGDEGRARAVYARVLELDPYDDRARAALGAAAPPPPETVTPRPDDQKVDLADWLRDDDQPISTRMRMREPTVSGDEQADFQALLRHFKEGVSRSLGEDDYESHYDLGVAYKEMGLLDDAVAEFQKALRSRSHRLPAYEALGQCFVEQERYQVAATVLSRALHEPGLSDEHRVGVLYLLAFSSEALQRWSEAKSYYQRVYATDINFRDAAARLAALEQVAH